MTTSCRECGNYLLLNSAGGVLFHDVAIGDPGSSFGWWTQCAGSGLPPLIHPEGDSDS